MKYRIVLSPGANADYSSVVRWYLNINPNLASRFTEEVDAILQRLSRMPYAFPVLSGAFRQALLKRFPYLIYYFVGLCPKSWESHLDRVSTGSGSDLVK